MEEDVGCHFHLLSLADFRALRHPKDTADLRRATWNAMFLLKRVVRLFILVTKCPESNFIMFRKQKMLKEWKILKNNQFSYDFFREKYHRTGSYFAFRSLWHVLQQSFLSFSINTENVQLKSSQLNDLKVLKEDKLTIGKYRFASGIECENGA